MVLRLSYLAVTRIFTVIRLLPVSGAEKDVEILALRHQLAILQRQITQAAVDRYGPGTDRVFLAALGHGNVGLPGQSCRGREESGQG